MIKKKNCPLTHVCEKVTITNGEPLGVVVLVVVVVVVFVSVYLCSYLSTHTCCSVAIGALIRAGGSAFLCQQLYLAASGGICARCMRRGACRLRAFIKPLLSTAAATTTATATLPETC